MLRRGAEGGIRTPARFYPPTPLAGEPLIATWVLLHGCKLRVHYLLWLEMKSGGESGIRTHGSFESPVFKTGSLNHSDISPRPISDQMQQLYYHIKARLSTAKVQKTDRCSALSIAHSVLFHGTGNAPFNGLFAPLVQFPVLLELNGCLPPVLRSLFKYSAVQFLRSL